MQHVVIEENAIKRVPELMNVHGYKKAFIICHANTWEAAGQEVEETVKAAGLGAVSMAFTCIPSIITSSMLVFK